LKEVYNVLKVILGETVVDSDEELPSTIVSAREQMYQAMNVEAPKGDLVSSLKTIMEAPNPEDKCQIPESTVELFYLTSDKYDDGLFAIKNPEYLKIIREVHARCLASKPPIYFPFGFGREKDLLKVKKAKHGSEPRVMTLTLKFSRWEKDGRVGYSCYAKQNK
jgi:hypothetical protein